MMTSSFAHQHCSATLASPRHGTTHLKFQFFVVLFALVQLVGNVALGNVQHLHLSDEILKNETGVINNIFQYCGSNNIGFRSISENVYDNEARFFDRSANISWLLASLLGQSIK